MSTGGGRGILVVDEIPLLPIYEGDNFSIGSYHFVCLGWKNGRIWAARYEEGIGLITYSISMSVALKPEFRITYRAHKEDR